MDVEGAHDASQHVSQAGAAVDALGEPFRADYRDRVEQARARVKANQAGG